MQTDFATPVGARPQRRVLVIGAGEAGQMVIRELMRHPEARLLPVAILDDDVQTHGTDIDGVPVLGSTREIAQAVSDYAISDALIAMPSQAGRVIHRLLQELRSQAPQVKHRI